MPLIRKFAVQGHAVPKGPQRARGPFPPELWTAKPEAPETEEYFSDSLHEALDDVRFFRCKYCSDILYEHQLDSHDCESEEE
jgi:hypothetical protein